MKIKFITNACCIYEQDGYRLLTDPWLTEPIFYGSWYHNPPITTKPQDVLDVDALYISHIHPDHLDEETLKHFRKDIRILTLRDELSLCSKHLKKLGFTNVEAIENETVTFLGPFMVTMFGPFTKHPHYECEIGNVVDSSILVESNGKKILNTNDNTPSIEAAHKLKNQKIDIAQLNYNAAGPYPACFMNLTPKERMKEHYKVVARGLNHMAEVAKAMECKYVMPFAGDYKLGGSPEKEEMNQYLGTTTKEVAAEYLKSKNIIPIVLKENEEFDLG